MSRTIFSSKELLYQIWKMISSGDQWRKCRIPVKTMEILCSLAASMDSWSRRLPPGAITAETPVLAASSTQSRNGKNASEAITRGRPEEGFGAVPGGGFRSEDHTS